MTHPGIEPWSPGLLVNTLPTRLVYSFISHLDQVILVYEIHSFQMDS